MRHSPSQSRLPKTPEYMAAFLDAVGYPAHSCRKRLTTDGIAVETNRIDYMEEEQNIRVGALELVRQEETL